MIGYGQLTVADVFNEFLLRIGDVRKSENIDWGTFLHWLNHAVDEVLMQTLPLKDWAYTSTVSVVDGQFLSPLFIEPIRVLVSAGGIPPFVEARKVDVREWSTIVNFQQNKHSWNQSSSISPVYMIWGDTIFLHPTSRWGETTVATNFAGMMDCYMFPRRMALPTDAVLIPYDFEEMLYMSLLSKAMFKLDNTAALPELQRSMVAEKQRLIGQYGQRKHTEKRVLESFIEPKIPYIPATTTDGELPNKLV